MKHATNYLKRSDLFVHEYGQSLFPLITCFVYKHLAAQKPGQVLTTFCRRSATSCIGVC